MGSLTSESHEHRTPPGVRAGDLPALLPARMLNEYAYCPRLFYLEWVQGEFRESADTVEGAWRHRNVDKEAGRLEPSERDGQDTIHARSVMLSSEQLGFIARIDLIEGDGSHVTPVDYKRGSVPREGPYDPERVQLCVQALILRDKGYTCDEGVIYYAQSRRRVAVPIDDDLVSLTLSLARQARDTASAGRMPPPLVDSPKCPRCSLVGICLPDEIGALVSGRISKDDVRRLFPARDEAQPVYIQEQGASVGKSGDRLVIRTRDEKRDLRLLDVSQLSVFGNVRVSAQALRLLARRGIPICHFTYGGWFEAITMGLPHKNIELRQRQFAVAADSEKSVAIARTLVAGKIKNCWTFLRRNHPDVSASVKQELARLQRRATRTRKAESLLGIEGAAARIYFSNLHALLKPSKTLAFSFRARNRRPPRDPVNALLSFAYALLVKDLTLQAFSVGLDPFLGFYHRPRYGRPALALDLAEEFRPIVADSVVISAVNNGEIQERDFIRRGDACALTPAGRRKFLAAYERRMDTLIQHPLLGYRLSYRRVFEVQARLLSRHLLGEIGEYPSFRTR